MVKNIELQLHRVTIKVLKGLNPYIIEEQLIYDGLPNALMIKYNWYFEYRRALLQVRYPRKKVVLTHFIYQPETETEKQRTVTRLNNLIRAKKRKQTELKNKVAAVRADWVELFPLEQHPAYKKVQAKLEDLQRERQKLEALLRGID